MAVGGVLGYAGRGWVWPAKPTPVTPSVVPAPAPPSVAPAVAPAPAATPSARLPLHAVLIYDPAVASQQALADLPDVGRELFDRVASYRQRVVNAPSVANTIWGQTVTKSGGPPTLIWIRQDGSIKASAKVASEADVVKSIPSGE